MSSSAYPSSSASPSPPSLIHTSAPTDQRFKAKLTHLLDTAVGYVEGLQEASDKVISNLSKRNMDNLDLHDWYWETDNDAEFYAVSYRSKKSTDEEIWNKSLPENLRLPAFFTQNCTKTVYSLLPLVRDALSDDQDFAKAVWSRVYIDMELVLFDVDDEGDHVEEPLSFVAHDFITVITKDNKRFAVDFTGEQFGIREWFQTKKEYNRHVMKTRESNPTSEHDKAVELETDNPVNAVLKSVISQAVKKIDEDRAHQGITWANFHLLPATRQDQLRQELISSVRADIVKALHN